MASVQMCNWLSVSHSDPSMLSETRTMVYYYCPSVVDDVMFVPVMNGCVYIQVEHILTTERMRSDPVDWGLRVPWCVFVGDGEQCCREKED